MKDKTRRRIAELEQEPAGPRRLYVRWANGAATVDGIRYPAGAAPEPAERDIVVTVAGGYQANR